MVQSACLFDAPTGTCGLAWTANGGTAVQLPESHAAATRACLLRQGAVLLAGSDAPAEISGVPDLVTGFLAGHATSRLPVGLNLSRARPFERQVYSALRAFGWGETVTYGGLACATSIDGGARAMAAATRRKAWPLVMPCHRVLTVGGRVGGISAHGGAATKTALLAREGVSADGGQPRLFQ